MASKNNRKHRNSVRITWAQAIRDIVIVSINKGQLPILAVCAIVVIILLRLPPQSLLTLTNRVFELLEKGVLWSYMIIAILVLMYFYHVRLLRKTFSDEAERIGNEKSDLQEQLANRKFKSSN